MKKNAPILIAIAIFSFIFFIAIGVDFSPLLRGPAPYPPDWQWPYLFTNTIHRLWFPAIMVVIMVLFVLQIEKYSDNNIDKKRVIFLFFAVVLHFLFQMGVLFFSRAGIGVLIQRIIHPDMNGYFTTALSVNNISQFLATYNNSVLGFAMHATGHPPGSILFFWLVNQLSVLLIPLQHLVSSIHFSHSDVQAIWQTLTLSQKTGAVASAGLIPLLSSLSLPLLYVLGKELYSVRAGIRAVFLYMVVPSITLFIPLSDVFFPLFSLSSFLLLVKGLKEKKEPMIFFSGLVFFIGLFFSTSLLPLSVLFGYFILLYSYKKKTLGINAVLFKGIPYALGLLVLPVILFLFFNFNSLDVAKTLMKGLPKGRLYHVWVFYNLYDFFVFTGIPLFLLYLKMLWDRVKDHLFIAFTIMLLLLNFSGAVRGEVGRIWMPFMSMLVLFVSSFLTKNLKISRNHFACIVILQAIQILVMQEFWVPLW